MGDLVITFTPIATAAIIITQVKNARMNELFSFVFSENTFGSARMSRAKGPRVTDAPIHAEYTINALVNQSSLEPVEDDFVSVLGSQFSIPALERWEGGLTIVNYGRKV